MAADAPDLVLDRAVRVALAPGDSAEGLALYRVSDDRFRWVGDEAGPDGIGGETRTLGTFGLARDTEPPVVRVTSPRADRNEGARPAIRAVLTDRGSGFGWSDITTEIDGVTQIVVFDPESAVLSGPSRRKLAPGRHTLTITVKDEAGNRTTETLSFMVGG